MLELYEVIELPIDEVIEILGWINRHSGLRVSPLYRAIPSRY